LDRIAVFIDAGYLFAQGSVALTGSKKPRTSISLDAPSIIAELKSLALRKAERCSLLRIYWYDGAVSGGHLSAEQARLAQLDDVKVRLGFINTAGQQKGVDSLIVTDIIELARQKAICDALLLSGDEDVRVGVQIAQNYGVRVHLVGIHPSRRSQSVQLIHEADRVHEWSAEVVQRFMSINEVTAVVEQLVGKDERGAQPVSTGDLEGILKRVADVFVAELRPEEIESVFAYWNAGERGVPVDLDRGLLRSGRAALSRDLDRDEVRLIRGRFRSCVSERRPSQD
jgi:uncharacterized LabA/DUF88 family protein